MTNNEHPWSLTAVSVSPNRAGMSVITNRLAMDQLAAVGPITVVDVGQSFKRLCDDIQKAE